jgi:hypothetical protein
VNICSKWGLGVFSETEDIKKNKVERCQLWEVGEIFSKQEVGLMRYSKF